jgi:DNA-binding MurR/RpiR family transcriptional regulator
MTLEEFIQTLDPRQVEAFKNLPSQQQQAYASGSGGSQQPIATDIQQQFRTLDPTTRELFFIIRNWWSCSN